MIFKWPDLPSV